MSEKSADRNSTQKPEALARVLIEEANEHYAAGEFTEAVQKYEEAIELHAEFSAFRFVIADIYFDQSDYAKATKAYRLVVEESPSHDQAWCGLGKSLLFSNETTSALAALDRCLQLDTENAEALYYGATGHAILGNEAKASDFLQRCLAIEPEWREQIDEMNILHKYLMNS